MGQLGEMEVVVGADVEPLVKGVAKAELALKKLPGASNQAANALQNLGRVAQDAPFGFIGIQNNLNPLLESFQRLKAESGSTGGALKALAGSLMGAGGLGLALSAVSSAYLLYTQHAQGAKKETAEAEKAIVLSIDSYTRVAQELGKVTEAMGTEAVKVSILFSALSESNIGLRERKGILEQLNQISPGYLGNLDKEKAGYNEISKAVFNYTESLAKSAEIKALLPQVDTLFKGLINAQVELNQLRRFQGNDPNDPGFFGLSPEDFKKQEAALLNTIKNFGNQIKQAKAGLSSFAGGDLNLSEILFGKTPELSKPKKEKIVKAFKFHRDTIEDLGKQFFDEATIKMKVPVSAELDFKKSLRGNSFASEGLTGILGQEAMTEAKAKAFLLGAGVAKGMQDGLNIGIEGLRFPQLIALAESTKASIEAYTNLQKEAFLAIAETFGKALGEAFSGNGNFLQNALGGVFGILGDFLINLGKAAVTTSKLFIAIKASKAFPALGIAGGIAAIAAGYLLKNIKLPAFAMGTQNFRGGLAVVGERGREVVNLPKGSGVIPNDKLAGISSNGMQVVVLETAIRGSDLILLQSKQSRFNGRGF